LLIDALGTFECLNTCKFMQNPWTLKLSCVPLHVIQSHDPYKHILWATLRQGSVLNWNIISVKLANKVCCLWLPIKPCLH